ncbi:hypothetical protein LTR62_006589 [Meristemomyces frigidus]|uniref:Uncharacterized protein n=1 Tax=Meristemomyces frigidus TaxID=1508187 RepID=A0AAN7YMS4_9PEZI|nr:hypothetical protein LTR62_006589 [Meristemomyces frigidus]
MALGRSPYQDIDGGLHGVGAEASLTSDSCATHGTGSPESAQQYDAKGRPTNPRTIAIDAEMRRAQNTILAIVGVVQFRDSSTREHGEVSNFQGQERADLHSSKDDVGESIDLLAGLIHGILIWWTECLVKRYQAGMLDVRMPFSVAVYSQLEPGKGQDWNLKYGLFLPGMVANIFHKGARSALHFATGLGIGLISEHIRSYDLRRRTQQRLQTTLFWVNIVFFCGCDALILPIEYYSVGQQLGVASAFPLVPSLESFSWLHARVWMPLIGVPVLRQMCSPATLLLGMNLLTTQYWKSTRLLGYSTDKFQRESSEIPSAGTARLDPLYSVFQSVRRARRFGIALLGWPATSKDNQPPNGSSKLLHTEEANAVYRAKHRRTSLERLPAQYLAVRVDGALVQFITLPLGTLVLNSVVASFRYLGSPQTGDESLLTLPPAFLSLRETLLIAARWANKVALSIALQTAVDTTLSAGVYTILWWRYYGRKPFAAENRSALLPDGV